MHSVHPLLGSLLAVCLLSGCTATKRQPPPVVPAQVNLAAIAPKVPEDIRQRWNRRTPPPKVVNNEISAAEMSALADRFMQSEEEKSQFIYRLMRIIDSTSAALQRPVSIKELEQRLRQAQKTK